MREVMSMREGGGTQIRWRRDGGRVESPNLGRRGGGHWEERRLRPYLPGLRRPLEKVSKVGHFSLFVDRPSGVPRGPATSTGSLASP